MALEEIKSRIGQAEVASQRDVNSTTLIAVSKVQPLDRVQAVLAQGHRVFGENRVQEAQDKWPALKDAFDGVELHLIGPLQSNKVRAAIGLFDVIHTVDSEKLARRIASIAKDEGHCPDIFIQVNTGDEDQKAGIGLSAVDGLVKICRELDLPLKGLMCIPPVDEEPSLHFALLAKIAKRNGLAGLSMGMSSDYERAVALGATHVRVGSAIFGERVKPA